MIGANNFKWSSRGLTRIVTDDFDLQQFFQHKLPLADLITLFFIYLFIYLFTYLFKERACPQLAKANLGGTCLNKQITKKYRDKKKKEEIQ